MSSKTNERALILGIYSLVLSSIGILSPILPIYLTSININAEELGLLFSVHMIAVAIGEMTWGRVIDRVGVDEALFTGTFLVAGLTSLFLVIHTLPLFFILFFLLGFTRAAIFISGRWYVAVHSHPSERASSMALLIALFSGTRAVSSVIGGAVVDRWGYSPALTISVLGPLLGGILFVVNLKRLRTFGLEEKRNRNFVNPEKHPSIRQVIFHFVGIQGFIATLNYFAFSIFLTYMPLLSTQVIGTDATGAGALFSIQGFVNLLAVIPLARLADRRGKKLFMMIGLLGTAGSFLGMSLASNYKMLVIFTVTFSLSFSLFGPAAVALLSESVPRKQQGTAIGMYGVFEDGGMIAGSALGGFVWERWGHFVAFLFGSVAAGVGAFTGFRFIKERPILDERNE